MHSLRLGKLFGVQVELHSTFVWLAAIVVILLAVLMPQNFLPIITLLFFLFLSVFFHELVHSVVAMQKGCSVKKIILLPIGGISVSEELPERPADEFLIAVAGPVFNFVVVAAILLLVSLVKVPFPGNWLFLFFLAPGLFEEAVLTYPLFGLLYVNLLLGAFNLFVPALPLDGGRVARSILAALIGFSRATRVITKLSVFIAIFLFLVGFFSGSIIVAIIAIFIYFGAKQEQEGAAIKQALEGETVGKLLTKKPHVVKGSMKLGKVAELMRKKRELTFLVKLGKGQFGVITVDEVAAAEKQATAGQVCKKVKPVKQGAKASSVLTKLLGKGIPMLPVTRNGRLLGVIEARELQKRYELNRALKGK